MITFRVSNVASDVSVKSVKDSEVLVLQVLGMLVCKVKIIRNLSRREEEKVKGKYNFLGSFI